MKTSIIQHHTRIISNSPGKKAYSDNGTRILKAACEDKQPAPEKPLLHKGDIVFGKYRIVEISSSGGESIVYKAVYNGKEYAVKLYTYDKHFNNRVYATINKSIEHKNIIRLYEYGYESDCAVEVTEYYEQGSIKGRKFPLDQLRSIVGQLVEALKILHSKRIYHNDLKPENILIDKKGNVVLTDFSLSAMESSHKQQFNEQNVGTLIQREDIGSHTPGYSSPEFERGISSPEGDMFSLGVCIFELFYGLPPFHSMNINEWNLFIYKGIRVTPTDAPIELDIVNGLLAYDPKQRLTISQVEQWTKGKTVAVKEKKFSYIINGKDLYGKETLLTDRKNLHDSLVKNWDEGQDRLFSDDIYKCFIGRDQDIAAFARRICDEYRNRKDSELGFLKFLYQLYPDDKRFVWEGQVFESMQQVSDYIIDSIGEERNTDVNELISLGVISFYYDLQDMHQQANAVRTIEHKYIELVKSNQNPYDSDPVINELSLKYAIAFMIASEKKFQIDGNVYTDRQIATNIEAFAKHLTDADGNPTSEYAGYLIAAGKIRVT